MKPRLNGGAALRAGFVSALLVLCPVASQAVTETAARSAILLDATTGAVLFEKNSAMPVPPASMSKLMTANMVFEALADKRLSLNEELSVSVNAAKREGSKMFTRAGSRIRVEDLLRGVIVQSGNDACVVLAEGLAGSEAAFVERMNARAKEIGLTESSFANATGLPHPSHLMSARDLARLARRLITTFPQYYHFYRETEFTWEKITQPNRNPLLKAGIGADGLKTGHTEEAGYGLVGSAVQDGRRLIVVVAGLPSMAARGEEAERLLRWGFREFRNVEWVSAGADLGRVPLWMGESPDLPVTVADKVVLTAPVTAIERIKTEMVLDLPVQTPVTKGQALGVLRINVPEIGVTEVPLVAAVDAPRGGFMVKLRHALRLGMQKLLGE